MSGFSKLWSGTGTVQPLQKGARHGHARENWWWDGFPKSVVMDYSIESFPIFVDGTKSFPSALERTHVTTSSSKADKWYDNESYYHLIFAVYCAAYCCGVSADHLRFSDKVYPVTTSIMRFHVYFMTKRIIRRLQGGTPMSVISKEFGAGELYGKVDKVPRRSYWKTGRLSDGTMGETEVFTLKGSKNTDYRRYVPMGSNGFTTIGLQSLNQSIEAYVYCTLGAQAKSRVSIVSHGAGSLETQLIFRELVSDSIKSYDTALWIQNMNGAIQDTNVVQNLAVSPSLWLVPSRLIILERPIPGYNNILRTATDTGMSFGVNEKLNYVKPPPANIMTWPRKEKPETEAVKRVAERAKMVPKKAAKYAAPSHTAKYVAPSHTASVVDPTAADYTVDTAVEGAAMERRDYTLPEKKAPKKPVPVPRKIVPKPKTEPAPTVPIPPPTPSEGPVLPVALPKLSQNAEVALLGVSAVAVGVVVGMVLHK